jgi:hypothetical protein
MPSELLYLRFCSVLVRVECNDERTAEFVRSDFSYFHAHSVAESEIPDVTVRVFLGRPPYDRIPEGTVATAHTKDAVVYKNRDLLYYDSGGEALVIYDTRDNSAEIHSLSYDLLFEKSYLMISSRVGELLDRANRHRIHAMGIAIEGQGIICVLPMGGGKTTLALSLLELDGFQLLSEEIPLVSKDGRLHPFPIRMGVMETDGLSIPEVYLKPFNRKHHGPKTLIDIEYFRHRIATTAEPGFFFLGKRVHSTKPSIRRISKFRAFLAMYHACVVGVGVPQLLEYLLRFDLHDLARQLPILWSRLVASTALVWRSETYELLLGQDRNANAALLAEHVRTALEGEQR